MAVVCLTVGAPGAGKTYVRAARFLVDRFLPESDGVHISNFPLYPDVIAETVYKRSSFVQKGFIGRLTAPFRRKHRVVTVESIKKRIHLIPESVLASWMAEESGPWDYFQGADLKGAHIAIDEIHNYLSIDKSAEYVSKWEHFLAEVRHRGCTFEGLTQDETRIHRVFTGRVALRYEVVGCEDLRDPFFNIRMMDWYELKAGFTGDFHKTVVERECHKQFKKWVPLHQRKFIITPDYFIYYNSYSASHAEKAEGVDDSDRSPQYEFQKRTKLSLLSWFFLRNFWTLSWRCIAALLVCWLCFFGGLTWCIGEFLIITQSMAKSNQTSAPVPHKKSEAVQIDSVRDQRANVSLPGEKVYSSPAPLSSSSDTSVYSIVFPDPAPDSSNQTVRVGDVKYTLAKLKELESEIQRLKLETEQGYKPVFFTTEGVSLKNGVQIYKGYVFRDGLYDGVKVIHIDLRNRLYELSNGKQFRM